ncbi:MAG: DNA topoisomerase (ATP-hydrolyzing) subunit B [Patescibacteria group bacterium]|nr:DNA topoisomerase (ATP-hydrolyzing) subunit B [Patescibacteria group bacterium]
MEEEKKKATETYDASKITVLEGLAPVRKRPGMYIGGTGIDGLHHLVWEVVDNSVDEAMAGFCDHIIIILHKDGSVSVEDNGRGIPVDKHKVTGKSALETVLTTLHAGGKFGDGGYKVSGGLHGVGVSVVNALSTWVKAEVKKDGKLYFQEYHRGDAVEDIKVIDKTEGTGTKITFLPDSEIFKNTTFSFKTILNHCRQQAYLTKGVMITVRDEREEAVIENAVVAEKKEEALDEEAGEETDSDKNMRTGRGSLGEDEENPPTGGEKIGHQEFSFYFEGGISSYVRHLNKNRDAINDPPMYVEKEMNDVLVELAVAYTDDFKEHLYSFANNINTAEGGTHLTGFRTALTRAINDYAKKNNLLLKGVALTGEDVREGLTCVLSVKLADPQFEGQTKAKLGNTEVRTIVDSVSATALTSYFEENPAEAKKIIEKCSLSARARMAARAARDTIIRKGALEGMTLPGKLADCSSKDSKRTEVYIVEGDSAGGSAKQGRDRNFQAILPLRGKILNVERARLDRMLTSDEIKALIVALGIGIGEEINYAKLRYDRVIIMTDADVDGAHIRTLLLTFFFRNFPDLIDKGHIYIAQPPLFSVQKGKEKHWVYTDGERDAIVKKFKGDKEQASGITIQRFKGLGEMNPNQLWETTMNPENRILLQVSMGDAEKADETFSMLMGDQVAPRKKFIQTRAKSVTNLDT